MTFAATFKERDASQPFPYELESKSERLVARATPATKSLIERASHLAGCSLSEFVLSKARDAAINLIAQYEVVVLTEREREAFLTALLHPTEPSAKALSAARRYREKARGG